MQNNRPLDELINETYPFQKITKKTNEKDEPMNLVGKVISLNIVPDQTNNVIQKKKFISLLLNAKSMLSELIIQIPSKNDLCSLYLSSGVQVIRVNTEQLKQIITIKNPFQENFVFLRFNECRITFSQCMFNLIECFFKFLENLLRKIKENEAFFGNANDLNLKEKNIYIKSLLEIQKNIQKWKSILDFLFSKLENSENIYIDQYLNFLEIAFENSSTATEYAQGVIIFDALLELNPFHSNHFNEIDHLLFLSHHITEFRPFNWSQNILDIVKNLVFDFIFVFQEIHSKCQNKQTKIIDVAKNLQELFNNHLQNKIFYYPLQYNQFLKTKYASTILGNIILLSSNLNDPIDNKKTSLLIISIIHEMVHMYRIIFISQGSLEEKTPNIEDFISILTESPELGYWAERQIFGYEYELHNISDPLSYYIVHYNDTKMQLNYFKKIFIISESVGIDTLRLSENLQKHSSFLDNLNPTLREKEHEIIKICMNTSQISNPENLSKIFKIIQNGESKFFRYILFKFLTNEEKYDIHQREMKSSLSSASQNIELSQNIEPSLRQEVSIKRKHQQAKIFNQAKILNKGSKQEVLI